MHRGINPDLQAATSKMQFDLTEMIEGGLLKVLWRMDLTLIHRMGDGSSIGIRNYALTLDGQRS